MKRKTITALVAAIVLLAGVVIVQATQPRGAVQGDPCPADIDDSGYVDVLDFLQLLAGWGPCPSARVVNVKWFPVGTVDRFFRIWSDNTLQAYGFDPQNNCRFDCVITWPPLDMWTDMQAPPLPPGAVPVNLSTTGDHLLVAYSDGTVYLTTLEEITPDGCTNPCGVIINPWELLP